MAIPSRPARSFVALWRAHASFRGESSERTWVYRIAHNVAATYVARAIRTRRDAEAASARPEREPERGPSPRGSRGCVRHFFERDELERQARLLERVWLWYLAPFVPSIVAIYAGAARAALSRPGQGGSLAFVVALFGATAGVLVLVGWLNVRAARSLRRRMAALPSEDSGRD